MDDPDVALLAVGVVAWWVWRLKIVLSASRLW